MAELITISAAPGWFLVTREGDDKPWSRQPLVAWAMIEDGGAPFVVGQVVEPWGEVVELVDVGRYVHETGFPRCECSTPAVGFSDTTWCTYCAGLVGAAS